MLYSCRAFLLRQIVELVFLDFLVAMVGDYIDALSGWKAVRCVSPPLNAKKQPERGKTVA
jgi:hypothetical protein